MTVTRIHGHRDDQIILQDCSDAVFTGVQVMNGKKAGLRLERSVPVLNDCSFENNQAGNLVRWDDSAPVLTDTDLPFSRGRQVFGRAALTRFSWDVAALPGVEFIEA